MATYHASCHQPKRWAFTRGMPKSRFANAGFLLYQATDFESPWKKESACFVSCDHQAMRNLPPRLAPDGRRYRPSLPVDLHYC
jgi:hypothetical protein